MRLKQLRVIPSISRRGSCAYGGGTSGAALFEVLGSRTIGAIAAARGLFSPQDDRWLLNEGAEWITSALRAGDIGSAAHTLSQRAPDLGITDAVLGQRALHEVPWNYNFGREARKSVAILEMSGRKSRFTEHLEAEIEMRGGTVQYLDADRLSVTPEHTLMHYGVEQPLPDAVFPTSAVFPGRHKLDDLQHAGVHVVNPSGAVEAGRDKNVMADIWAQTGISMPNSRPHLQSTRDVLAAADEVGYPVVLKLPRSAMSTGVKLIRNPQELVDQAKEWGVRDVPNGYHMQGGLLVQEALDLGKRDIRFHGARDAVTGEMRVVGATERVSMGEDFRANCGDQGNMIRPIYDLSGNDPALTQPVIDTALKAGDVAGMDWFSADVSQRVDTGEPVLIEIDNYSHPLEMNVPTPRAQQTFPRLADLLLYGDREEWARQAAAHDRPPIST